MSSEKQRAWVIGLCAGVLFAVPLTPREFASGERKQEIAAARYVHVMRAAAESGDARLRLGFADRSGALLAYVQVIVDDSTGQRVADLVSDGPWLNLELDPGVYHITAIFEGEAQRLAAVQVKPDTLTTRVIYWDLEIIPTEMLAEVQPSALT